MKIWQYKLKTLFVLLAGFLLAAGCSESDPREFELEGIAGLPLPDNDTPLEIPVRRGVGVGLGAELHHGRRARPTQDHAVVEIADRPFDKGIVQRQGGIDTERLVDREIVPVAAADRTGALRQQDGSRGGLRFGDYINIGGTPAGRTVACDLERHRGVAHAAGLAGRDPANRLAGLGIGEIDSPIGVAVHVEGQVLTLAAGGQALLLDAHPADTVDFRVVGAGSPGSQQSRRRAYP